MSLETPVTTREKVRVFVTGSCDGLAELREALGRHSEVEMVGWSEGVDGVRRHADRWPPPGRAPRHAQLRLAGGRARGDPRAHAGAGHPARLRRGSALLEQALEADVSDVLLLPQMTENVVFAIRKASHSGRRTVGGGSHAPRRGRIVTVFSPKGGTGKTVTATNLALYVREVRGQEHAPPRPRPPVRRRGDHARARAGEDDLRPGRRAGRARLREARRVHDAPSVGARRPAGAAAPGGRRARHRGQARPPARGGAGVVRRDRRRHLAVLPRADARDARPHRRAPARLRARRADAEERPAQPADARAARVPAEPDPRRPEPRELEGRDEAGRGRRRPRDRRFASSSRATGRSRSPSTVAPRSSSPTTRPTSRARSREMAKGLSPVEAAKGRSDGSSARS